MAKNWQETLKFHLEEQNTLLNMGDLNKDVIAMLESQAKATWEARQQEVAEAEQRGIRKVIAFCKQKIFNTFIDRDTGEPYIAFRDNADKEWQAFLKGVEKVSSQ